MLFQGSTIDEFGKDVTGVFGARYTMQSEISFSKSILYPEIGRRKVSDFAQTPATANPHCSCRVGMDRNVPLHAEVEGHCLKAESLRCPLAYATQLCLGRAEGHGALRCRPVFDQVGPSARETP